MLVSHQPSLFSPWQKHSLTYYQETTKAFLLTSLPKIVNKHLPENFNRYTLLHLHYATFIPYICLCCFFSKNPPGMKAPLYKAILRLSHWKHLLHLLPFEKLILNARVARYSVPARSFMDPFIKAAYTRSGLLGAGQWSSTTGYTRCRKYVVYVWKVSTTYL